MCTLTITVSSYIIIARHDFDLRCVIWVDAWILMMMTKLEFGMQKQKEKKLVSEKEDELVGPWMYYLDKK